MIAPGQCRDCPHRRYCGDVGECRPLVFFHPGDPRARRYGPTCTFCGGPITAGADGWTCPGCGAGAGR